MLATGVQLSFASLVLLASLASAIPLDAEQQRPGIGIESGTTRQRMDALIEIGETRSPAILAAVRREADRMMREFYRGSIATKENEEPDLYDNYTGALVQILGESGDPAHIPVFIDHAGSGSWAANWLVKFGNVAVPAMLQAARRHRDDSNQRMGVCLALARMLKADPVMSSPLTDESRQQIGVLAAELIEKQLGYGNSFGIAVLALATGRPDLRQQLERLAVDESLWRARGLRDRALVTQAQGGIAIQLRQVNSRQSDTPIDAVR